LNLLVYSFNYLFMTPITFTNPDVAANFVALTDVDVTVITVADTTKGTVPQYSGLLSNVIRSAAANMVRRGSNLLALKINATLEDATTVALKPIVEPIASDTEATSGK
jgi:hypothetical protein